MKVKDIGKEFATRSIFKNEKNTEYFLRASGSFLSLSKYHSETNSIEHCLAQVKRYIL